jgi:hypothetical protein
MPSVRFARSAFAAYVDLVVSILDSSPAFFP